MHYSETSSQSYILPMRGTNLESVPQIFFAQSERKFQYEDANTRVYEQRTKFCQLWTQVGLTDLDHFGQEQQEAH